MIGSCQILNGSQIAKKHLDAVTESLSKSAAKPVLATIQVGDAKDATLYFMSLERLFKKIDIKLKALKFPENIQHQELCNEIAKLGSDPSITAVIVLAPLPPHIHSGLLFNAIDVLKDVEGRRVIHGIGDRITSPTANAVLTLLKETGLEIAGKEAVLVGHSDLVGKPTALLLLDEMATVTVCHKKTKDLRAHIEKADIVVAAAGKPHLVKGEWIKSGAIVIDVGENMLDGKLVGDVEFEKAKERASFITPVPGGVGPVTNVMLVQNLIKLYELQKKLNGNR